MLINRLKKELAHLSPEAIHMMHAGMVKGFAIALLACLVILPLPLYLIHSFRYFEIKFLAIGVLVLISILAYNRVKIKNYKVDVLIGIIISTASFLILAILLWLLVMIIMYSITGSNNVMPFDPSLFTAVSLYPAMFAMLYVPENKQHWCVPAGSLFCCIVVAVWSFLKLHGQG